MRVSTSQIYSIANLGMADAQAAVTKTEEQISTGKRVLKPSDDPIAATNILKLNQELAQLEQYRNNISIAENNVQLEEVVLESVIDLMARMKEISVNAANTATLTPSDYNALAAEVDSRLDELMNLMNTQNSTGTYIFSGFQGDTKPFERTGATEFQYAGDEGQLRLKVSESVDLPVTDSGKKLFVDVPSFTNTVRAYESSTNRSSPAVTITGTQVIDQEAYDEFYPEDMVINFNAAGAINPPASNFTITERSTGKVIVANQAYIPGDDVEVNGVRFQVIGTPFPGELAIPATIPFGTVAATDFTAAGVGPSNITLSVGGRTENFVLDQNITGAFDLMTALNASVETEIGSGADQNAAKLANLGITVDSSGFQVPRGLNLTINGGTIDTDAVTGIVTTGNGTVSTDGVLAKPGDQLFVDSANKQNLLTTIAQLSEAMKNMDTTQESKQRMASIAASTLGNLDTALTNIVSVESEIGARLNTLESTKDLHLDTELFSKQVLSDLQDLDYADAASRLSLETFILQAAQQTFVKVSGLSLFNFL